jgi:hypothetical protein
VGDETNGPLANLDAATHRRIGIELYNSTWELLEKPDRTADEIDEMIHRAHASRWHWARAGTTVNSGRGEWLCSRVYSVLGRAEPALWHARRSVARAEASPEREDWDLAATYEAMARAHLCAGDRTAARAWSVRARAELARVAEADDRESIDGDLTALGLD